MEDKRVFHEINERDMQETPDVVTALDETIPSPARIQMTETVELPEVVSGRSTAHAEKDNSNNTEAANAANFILFFMVNLSPIYC